ncbi:MAG TPA: DUF2207 domain-containing protein, partial [Candidatus Deferrimicrobiaceae bacterium]
EETPSRRRGRGPFTCLPRMLVPVVVFLLPLAVLSAPVRAEDFSITSFRADIEVRADSSLRVVETIDAFFHRPRHGIYRDIPFRYTDELGKESYTPLEVVSVADLSGTAWRHKTERSGGFLRIRIGDPDRFVEGRQVYVVTYVVENGVLFFPDHDELYWNVTGNEWPVPIRSAAATATVTAGGRSLALRTGAYTGTRGSREEAFTVATFPNGATFTSTRPFGPGEGMTIVLGWEKGVVRPGSAVKATIFRYNLSENWVFAAPLLCLGFMLARWYGKGRDPSTGGPLVVAYGPPEEDGRPLSPAEMGVLLDEKLDPKDITASVVSLAVKRRLSIEEIKVPGFLFDKTDYVLRKTKEPGQELPPFERLLLERLFRGQATEVSVSDLKLEFFRNLEELKREAFAGLARMKCFAGNPLSVISRYRFAGLVIFFAGGGGMLLAGKLGWGGGDSAVIAAILSGGVVCLFAPFMPVKTLRGSKAVGKIRGFEEFLTRAEKDRLERMQDANLFEKFLPYAIALGVSERWAKAFEGIYQAPPRWYASESGAASFRPSAFNHSLGSALSSLSSAMHSSPRSSGSGFSGGGSSGGGGGGGGGGSW